MNTGLDPVVAKKLDQFRRRRSRLIIGRGLSVGVATFLIAMGVVALADWYWLLTDETRWLLSAAAYGAVAVAVWLTCLTRLRRLPGPEEVATQIESTEPELRENLRSAVELAVEDPGAIHDSPVFRSLLQGQVAQQMGRVRVANLLPIRLVAKSIVLAVLVVGVVAVVLSTGGERIRQLATRAVLPGANIARVSRIQVDVLEPTPKSLTVAADEAVAVVVEVSGGEVNEVVLETTSETHGTVRQSMWPRSDAEFAANINVVDDAVEYRIFAGDAVTERYLIESRPRPRVVAFHKNYEYPEYTNLKQETLTEKHGDLIVLEGTTTELVLDLDQDVATAELRIDPIDSDEIRTVPMIPVDTEDSSAQTRTQWRARLPIRENAVYKVRLVSRDTGFENIFSPKYEIRPVPDLIPRAGFVDAEEGTMLLPPNDILALRGMAEDDLPLAKLDQQISVNGRDWLTVHLDTTSVENDPRRVLTSWDWDLLPYKLKTGDQVLTKLVATDLKGSVGESVPMRIVVAGVDFDPERHAVMERKLELFDKIEAFSEQVIEQKETALAGIERFSNEASSTETQSTELSELNELAVRQREAAGELIVEIESVEREMPAGADAHDLDLTGRVVAKLQRENPNAISFLIGVIDERVAGKRLADNQSEDNSPSDKSHREQMKKDVKELKRAFERSADDAKSLAYHYQQLMAHNFVQSLAVDLDTLYRQQQSVVESKTQTWERLLRHETIVINQLQDFEKVIRRHRSRLPDPLERPSRDLLKWAGDLRGRLVDATESEDKLDQLRRVSNDVFNSLRGRQRIERFEGGIPGRVVGAWRDFQNRSGSLHVPIERAANSADEEAKLAVDVANAEDSAKAAERQAEKSRFTAELDVKYDPSLGQLRSRRELTQARPDANSQYAADAGLTHRAVSSLMSQRGTEIVLPPLKSNESDAANSDNDANPERTPEPTAEVEPRIVTVPHALREVAPAYRKLEAGHDLKTSLTTLDGLLAKERWESQSLQARIDHPRQWDLVTKSWELASERLRNAGVDRDLVGRLDAIRWSEPARVTGRKVTERRWRDEMQVSASVDLLTMRDELRAVVDELEPELVEARAIIAQYAPTIPQMARQAAEAIREFEVQTTTTADAAQQAETEAEETENQTPQNQTPETNDPANSLAELRQEQQAVNEQISDLLDALVEDANSQDLLAEEERERARDADDSIAVVREPAQMMNRALELAEQAPTPQQQASQLSQAAEQQEKTAQALELVAEHFERLDDGMEVADSREQLRQAERDMGIARQMDQQYEPTEQLAEMAQQTPAQLMQELEAELERNPLMQEALSEISQNTIEESQNALEYAAAEDQEIQQANERSDAEFQQQKKEIAEDLRNMASAASRLSNELVAQAKDAASRGRTPEATARLQQARDTLNRAASEAAKAQENNVLSELADTAQKVRDDLKSAADQLAQAAKDTDRGKSEDIHDSEKSREAQKKSSERSRDRFFDQLKRNAESLARRADEAKRREERSVRDAEKQVASAKKRLDDAKRKANEKPDDQGRKNTVAYEEKRLAKEQQDLVAEKQDLERAKDALQEARQNQDEARRRPRPDLKAPNPSTELADQYADEAVKAARELEKQANEVAEKSGFEDQLTPSAEQLANATKRQDAISEDVEDISNNLARAARHEQRLQNSAAAEQLQASAEDVAAVADGESEAAESKLEAAQQEAAAAEESGKSGNDRPNDAALAAQNAAKAAEAAIANQAEQLAAVLAPMQQDAESGANTPEGAQANAESGQQDAGQPPSGEQEPASAGEPGSQQGAPTPPTSGRPSSPAEQARAQQLARTLDELDRMQAESAQQSDSSSPAAEPAAAPQQLFAQASQAQQAQLAAARSESQQQAMQAMNESSSEAHGVPPDTGALAEFQINPVNRLENSEWGKLRNQAAEDVTTGRGEAVSEEYRTSVEAYFRVLAERSRKR